MQKSWLKQQQEKWLSKRKSWFVKNRNRIVFNVPWAPSKAIKTEPEHHPNLAKITKTFANLEHIPKTIKRELKP